MSFLVSLPRPLNIRDLNEVTALLERHHYSKASYHRLGLRLKLSHNTLEKIRKDRGEVDNCFTECLASWLRKVDDVENPTIDALIAALRGIGENAVADGIDEERQTVPMSRSEISDRPMLATPPTIHINEGHLMHPTIGNPGVHNLEHKIDEVSVLRDIANELQDKYDFLVLAVKNSLKRNCIDIEDAKTLIKERLKRKARVVSKLMPCMDILDKANDFESFFRFLSKYDFIGYINYRLLKNLSLLVDDDKVNERFAEYEKEYAKLLSAASFKSLIPLFEKHSDLSPTAPLGLPYVSFCLEKPDSFTSARDWVSTFDEFSWSQDAFLKQLQKKCIIITYAILPSGFDNVIRDLKDPLILKKLKDKEITVIKLPEIEEDPQIETAKKEPISIRVHKQDIMPVCTKTPPDSLIPPLSAPPRLTQEGMFLGFIVIEKDSVRPFRSDSDVERDGGGLSKIRDSVRKERQIKLISTPKGESPGRFTFNGISGSETVEFYADKRILEATDNGDVVTAVVYDRDPEVGKFSLKSTSTETNSNKMLNASNYCICLVFKDNQPELVSLHEDEIKRESNIIQYLTVFQYGSADHDIAIFFSYGDGRKQYNCYLIPQASDTQVSCNITLKIIDVTNKSPDEQRVIHSEYVKFTMNPEDTLSHHIL